MKILIYSHVFSPSIGGVEKIVQSLAEGLEEVPSPEGNGGCKVTLVTQTAAGASDTSVFSFPVVRRPTLTKLWRLVRETDIVHIAGPSLVPLLLAFLARKPVVVEHHGYQAICPNGLLTYQPGRTICPGHFQQRRYWKCWRCQSCEVSPQRSLLSLLRMFPRSWLVQRAARNLAITRHVLERHRLPRAEVVYYGIEDPLAKGNPSFSAADPRDRIRRRRGNKMRTQTREQGSFAASIAGPTTRCSWRWSAASTVIATCCWLAFLGAPLTFSPAISSGTTFALFRTG